MTAENPPPGPSRPARVFIVVYLLVQLTIPVVMLTRPKPVALGWQMFSSSQPQPTFVVVAADGGEETVTVDQLAERIRPEADYRRWVPTFLCREPGAVAVVVEHRGGTERVACP